jgi:hypothetical protein
MTRFRWQSAISLEESFFPELKSLAAATNSILTGSSLTLSQARPLRRKQVVNDYEHARFR